MFIRFGQMVSRTWLVWLAAWAFLGAGVWWGAPAWRDVAKDGEFGFMPADSPSRVGETLLRRAFPDQRAESSIVVVLARQARGTELTDADWQFISRRLRPGLERIAREETVAEAGGPSRHGRHQPLIMRIRTFEDSDAGSLLISQDRKASLVLVDLATDYMVRRNIPVVARVDDLLKRLHREGAVPAGLQAALTGSAVLGRDMMVAESQSAHAIERWTIGLVVVLLLAFYRAPLLAVIPLISLALAVEVGLRLLMILAGAGYVELFRGLDVYTTVVAYAAGVDYNLFLISRYQEELESDDTLGESLAEALGKIGGALAASAATVICGIGTLMFAGFGKFREAGFGIAFCLFVMLCATLTLTPALLRLAGRWVFWPRRIGMPPEIRAEAPDEPRAPRRVGSASPFETLWSRIGQQLRRWPGTIWLVTVVALSPFAGYGLLHSDDVNYGLIQGLPADAPSRKGTRLLTDHYPAGDAGPLTLVLRSDRVDFAVEHGRALIGKLADRLKQRRGELKIADLRSLADPLGITPAARQTRTLSPIAEALLQPVVLGKSLAHYVSNTKDLDHHVTRMNLVLTIDPFTRQAIRHLGVLEAAIRHELPDELRTGSELQLTGPTPSFRDLKRVADQDRVRINLLVATSVLGVLVILLRRLAIPLYLIVSVLFGYLVTLGVTVAVFRLLDGPDFPGLDWTVPIFLFTLLIAVGEDYNIILATRIDEEQARHGPVDGIIEALTRTGGIISGCGFIMAGTFSSLAFGGSLARMYQLGFALTFGVLLDTFVVRPVLVPAYLILVNSGRLGRLGTFLGAVRSPSAVAVEERASA